MNLITPLLNTIKKRLSVHMSEKLVEALNKTKKINITLAITFFASVAAWIFWVPDGWGLDNIKNAESMTEFLYLIPPSLIISILFNALMLHFIVTANWKKQLNRVLQLDFSNLQQTPFVYNNLALSIKKLTEEENKQLFALPLDKEIKDVLIKRINVSGYLTYNDIIDIEALAEKQYTNMLAQQDITPAKQFLQDNNFNTSSLDSLISSQDDHQPKHQTVNGNRFKDVL